MKLDHAALWTPDLEASRNFYTRYFGAQAGPRYDNPKHGFRSYFLSFEGGSRLELMQMPGVEPRDGAPDRPSIGLVHLAFDVGDEAAVDALTRTLQRDGYPILGEPRRTGDGYYESTVLDPDGNRIEIAAMPAGGSA